MSRDYRDLVIDALAAEETDADANDRLVDAILEAQSYRLLAQQAIHALHELTRQHERLRAQHQRLREDYCRLRESILLEAA